MALINDGDNKDWHKKEGARPFVLQVYVFFFYFFKEEIQLLDVPPHWVELTFLAKQQSSWEQMQRPKELLRTVCDKNKNKCLINLFLCTSLE